MPAARTPPLEGAPRPDVVEDRIVSWGLGAAWLAATTAVVANLVDFGAYHLRIRLLDMNTHASVFGALSLLALVAAVGGAVLLAVTKTTRTGAAFAIGPLLAALLALRVIHPAHVVVVALPIAATTFALLWLYGGPLGSRRQRIVRAGSLILVGSYVVRAFGDGVVSALGYGVDTWPYQVELVVKHGSELAGWMVVATGLATALAEIARPG
jgi:hypothetical protein